MSESNDTNRERGPTREGLAVLSVVLLTAIAVVLIAIMVTTPAVVQDNAVGTDNETGSVTDDPTDEAEQALPLASAFGSNLTEYYEETDVYVTQDGGIILMYETTAETSSELETELHQIAVEYARIADRVSADPSTLLIVVDEVQAVVPEPTVTAHVNGTIDQDAFLETIEVTSVERE